MGSCVGTPQSCCEMKWKRNSCRRRQGERKTRENLWMSESCEASPSVAGGKRRAGSHKRRISKFIQQREIKDQRRYCSEEKEGEWRVETNSFIIVMNNYEVDYHGECVRRRCYQRDANGHPTGNWGLRRIANFHRVFLSALRKANASNFNDPLSGWTASSATEVIQMNNE